MSIEFTICPELDGMTTFSRPVEFPGMYLQLTVRDSLRILVTHIHLKAMLNGVHV